MVKTPSLGIRVRPEVKEALEQAAKDDVRSMSSMVEKILVEHLKRTGYLSDERSPPKPKIDLSRTGLSIRPRNQRSPSDE
jgi:hypothetical protein